MQYNLTFTMHRTILTKKAYFFAIDTDKASFPPIDGTQKGQKTRPTMLQKLPKTLNGGGTKLLVFALL